MAKRQAAGDIWTDNANWYPLQLYYMKYDMFHQIIKLSLILTHSVTVY